MQYLRGIYDSSSHKLIVEFKNLLLEKYWELLLNLVKEAGNSSYLPKDIELKKVDSGKALVIIPCTIEGVENYRDGQRIKNLPDIVTEHLSSVLETFSRRALEEELEKIEFIPLSGYSMDKLKEDIELAIKDKRDLVLVDTYDNYRKLVKQKTAELNQCRFEYLDNDYADVAFLIHSGNIKELKKYRSRLEKTSWI